MYAKQCIISECSINGSYYTTIVVEFTEEETEGLGGPQTLSSTGEIWS